MIAEQQADLPTYPELDRIATLRPIGPQVLLGRTLWWTEKRDGTQLRVALVDDKISISTRHQDTASEQFQEYYRSTPEAPKIEAFIREHSGQPENPVNNFCFYPVVFGELLVKGKSPARFELHNTHSFVVFDIWSKSSQSQTFLPYPLLYQYCFHFGIPVVECWAETQHMSLESLYATRDEVLEMAANKGREGTVVKTLMPGSFIYAKEKRDVPVIPIRVKEEGTPQLPPLPDSEVMGAIAKAHADLGDAFLDKKQAMPLVARYIREEMEKHLCWKPAGGTYFRYYTAYLENLREEKAT